MINAWLKALHIKVAQTLEVPLLLGPLNEQGAFVALEDQNVSFRGTTITGSFKILFMMDVLNIESFEDKKKTLLAFFEKPIEFQGYYCTFRIVNAGTKWTDKKITSWLNCHFFGAIRPVAAQSF